MKLITLCRIQRKGNTSQRMCGQRGGHGLHNTAFTIRSTQIIEENNSTTNVDGIGSNNALYGTWTHIIYYNWRTSVNSFSVVFGILNETKYLGIEYHVLNCSVSTVVTLYKNDQMMID